MRFLFFFLINIKWTLFLLRELISCFFKNYLAFFILVFPLNGQNVRLSVIKALRGTSLSREIRKVFSTRLHFMSNWYFPKSCEIERLDMRLWEKLKNCETHGRIVRVGRSVTYINDTIDAAISNHLIPRFGHFCGD